MSTNPENGPIPSYTPSSTSNSEPQPQSATSSTSSSQQWQQQAPGPDTTGNQWAQQQGNWQQPAGSGQPQQPWTQPQYVPVARPEPKGFARVFDFSFKRFALEDGTGVIFIVITVLLTLQTLFNLPALFEFRTGAYLFLDVVSNLLQLVFYLLLIRVFLELGTAVVKLWLHTAKLEESEEEQQS